MGNAALARMGWMQEKNIFIGQSAEVFIFFSSHVRLLLEVGTLSIKCSKTLYFRKSAVKLISFRLKTYQVYSGNVFRLDAIGYCVFQKSAALIFVLRKAFFRAYTIWKAIIMVIELIEWSAIWSEIIHVISVRFEITSQCFQTKIASHSVQLPLYYSHFEIAEFSQWSSIEFVQKWKQKGFYIQFCIQNRNDAI